MLNKKKHPLIAFLSFLMFFVAFTLFDSGIIDLSISYAHPFLLLCLLTVYSCFASLPRAALAGVLCGTFADSVASGSFGFNTLALFALSIFAHLLANNVFNKNLKATVALCLFISAIYYLFYWLIFLCFRLDFDGNSLYLLKQALPSVIYTAVFALLFYPIFKKFDEIRNET